MAKKPAKPSNPAPVESNGESQPISLVGLASRFFTTHNDQRSRSFGFLLGSGASKTSGIKTAPEMVRDWVRTLYIDATADTFGDGQDWANDQTLGIKGYDPKNPAASYSELYRRMFGDDPESGYAYLQAQMADAEPSLGYAFLSRILEETHHRIVVTTNFDNLVADSLLAFGKKQPLVCGHESLAGFVRPNVDRPMVVKVHRDLLLEPKSTTEDVAKLPPEFEDALTRLFRHMTPIVIGYGGNDPSLMTFLSNLPEKSIPGGVYWCYIEGGSGPTEQVRRFVKRQAGRLVPIPGFDEVMFLLGDRLRYEVPKDVLIKRATERSERLGKQADDIRKDMAERNERARQTQEAARARPGASTAELASADLAVESSKAITEAVQSTIQRGTGKRAWWQWHALINAETDLIEKDKRFRQAIDALPQSAPLLSNYALFLHEVRWEYDDAEALYQRALEADPKHPTILGNYALFLKNVRKAHDSAEALYKRALEADPKDATILDNYANFLNNIRKDHDGAEALFKRALEADPKHANKLGNYANFLMDVRKDHDGAEALYKRALEADPARANTLGNYARFLLKRGRIEPGLGMLARAREAQKPHDPPALRVEIAMYGVCHQLPDRWRDELKALKRLVTADKITTDEWDYSGVIATAKERGHPSAEWLDRLAEVCAGRAPGSSLDGWTAWKSA
ncbi:MAG: tetratricopeptide repeat protein [Phycisphaerales bacterium]